MAVDIFPVFDPPRKLMLLSDRQGCLWPFLGYMSVRPQVVIRTTPVSKAVYKGITKLTLRALLCSMVPQHLLSWPLQHICHSPNPNLLLVHTLI